MTNGTKWKVKQNKQFVKSEIKDDRFSEPLKQMRTFIEDITMKMNQH